MQADAEHPTIRRTRPAQDLAASVRNGGGADDPPLLPGTPTGHSAAPAAPTPPPEGKPRAPRPAARRALLINLWVLLAAAALVVIPIVAKDRLAVREPLQSVRWVAASQPFVMPLAKPQL